MTINAHVLWISFRVVLHCYLSHAKAITNQSLCTQTMDIAIKNVDKDNVWVIWV